MSSGIHFNVNLKKVYMTIGGFPIEIETKISKLITYSLAILQYKNTKLHIQ